MIKSLTSVFIRAPQVFSQHLLISRAAFSSTNKPRKGIYAGSFDPPSNGHLDIIERGAKLCDKLYVGIAVNSAKKYAFKFTSKISFM